MVYHYPHPEYFLDWDKPDFNKLNKPIVLWGAGKVGGVAAHCMKKKSVEYAAFCDVAADKWGTQFCGHEVISPDELMKRYPDAAVIITAVFYNDIYDTLCKLGFQDVYDCAFLFMEIDFTDYDFWMSKDYAVRMVEQCLGGILEQKKHCGILDQICLHITTKCTLRCRDCSALIPYVERHENYDAIDILSDLHNVLNGLGHVRAVNFYGGEPLLHPELARMIRAVSHESRIDRVSVITNGTIVPDEGVLQAMREEPRFMVRISDYGEISGKVCTITKLLEQYKIQYEITNYTYWDRGTKIEHFNETAEQLVKKFERCTSSNLLYLHNRKGYLCCVGSAGCNEGFFPESTSNYIDLTDTENFPNRLKDFIARPSRGEYFDACKYCSGMHCVQFEEKVPVAVQAKGLLKFPKLP